MSSSRKKQRVAASESSAPDASPTPSPDALASRPATLDNGQASAFVVSSDVSFSPLSSLSSPTASYITELKLVSDFKDQISAELLRITETVASISKRGGNADKGNVSSGNVWETPSKKLLSAQVELARMDFMESEPAKSLLYRESHFAAEEAEDKAAMMATDAWKEISHILALYEELRRNLVIRTGKRNKFQAVLLMIAVFLYTCFAMPLMALTVPMQIFQPFWNALGMRNHFYPVDLCQKWYSRGFLALCGVRVTFHGLDQIDDKNAVIGMFSHASNLDPVIIASGPLAWKWIGKKSLFKIPVVGWLLTGLQHIAIERENREKAIKSLQKAAEIVHKYKRCIAVSPEGTRSKSGRLQDFKKGAFHTAMQVSVPIIPLLLDGAYDLWPSGALFVQPGMVHVHVLKPIPVTPKDDYNALASTLRRTFLESNLITAKQAIANGGITTTKGEKVADFTIWALWVPTGYAVLYLMVTATIAAIKLIL